MSDGSSFPQPVVSATEPRRWIAAIVGGVLLGEALWSMLQLLIRDWAAPALANAMGQGPTQNPAAFEPLPLVVAFVEACVAAIVLVLLMAWAQRKTRVVVRTVTAAVAPSVAATSRVAAPSAVAPAPAVAPVPRPVAAIPIASVAAPALPFASTPVAPASGAPAAAPVAATPVAPQPSKPASPPAPKKPKTIYYNSVGEPIEE
jgi:hypothetical protein